MCFWCERLDSVHRQTAVVTSREKRYIQIVSVIKPQAIKPIGVLQNPYGKGSLIIIILDSNNC